MNDEYVDITSQEYHNRWKKRYMAIQIIRFCLNLFVTVGFVCLVYVLAPFIKGDQELETVPLTLSKLEVLIGILIIAKMLTKTHL